MSAQVGLESLCKECGLVSKGATRKEVEDTDHVCIMNI